MVGEVVLVVGLRRIEVRRGDDLRHDRLLEPSGFVEFFSRFFCQTLLFFVMVDGWNLVIGSLVKSFY